jgi:ketosteroid isomerase-like protein
MVRVRSSAPLSRSISAGLIPLFVVGAACSEPPQPPSASEAGAGIDSLNLRLIQAYRNRDPLAYAALYTDSAVFEWPAFNTVRGRAGLEAMARSNWASLADMDLQLTVSSRHVASNHATEFGAFQQSWRDPNCQHRLKTEHHHRLKMEHGVGGQPEAVAVAS